ncbi:IS21 family transposase [Syntrophomonas wolfei]|jgi:transposase|uniref:IS21 family transposase n=1 Tax=Syntrophomonas wolfei TaxID=863 RepID=UPI000773F368|nr:IS21 family transposase [Syntrophomonas wolfei]
MNVAEGWNMYLEIQDLKKMHFNVSQISRRLDLSRTTVYKYLDMPPEEMEQILENRKTRTKKLDKHRELIKSWLIQYQDMTSAQVLDWLQERKLDGGVSEGTVRNYVRQLREECVIPQVKYVRQYEAVDELPAGQQMQMDFGQIALRSSIARMVTLYFATFVLAHSRHKYVEWLDRPFTTRDLINVHENAFEYYGGMTKEIVYDQDHLILVSENGGDLLLTKEFGEYQKTRKFKIYMCRKADPETKGKVENVVKYVKRNFAKNRTFHNLEKLNEDCLAWLERTGNGKVHNTTKKIPVEVFALEKQHLIPVPHKINISTTKIITRVVRKDNTIVYKGNRYALPLGTYAPERRVVVKEDEGILIIANLDDELEIIRYPVCLEKGRLIKSSDCRREKDKGIDTYLQEVAQILNDSQQAYDFLGLVRQEKPRYIRDQLKIIKDHSLDKSPEVISKALNYCLKNRLYGATDFVDSLNHFNHFHNVAEEKLSIKNDIQPLYEVDRSVLKTSVEVRDINVYIQELQGVRECQQNLNNSKTI